METSMIKYGVCFVDTDNYTVIYRNTVVKLRRKEYQLLLLFLEHPTLVFNYEQIVDHLWEDNKIPTPSSLRSHIKALRDAFQEINPQENIIKTLHGLGYCLNPSFAQIKPPQLTPNPPINQTSKFLPSTYLLQKFLSLKDIAYIVINEQMQVQYFSENINNYCAETQLFHIGIDARKIMVELWSFEEEIVQIKEGKIPFFEYKGICNYDPLNDLDLPRYHNILIMKDQPDGTQLQEQQLIYIFFEDCTIAMYNQQKLTQKLNEILLNKINNNSHFN